PVSFRTNAREIGTLCPRPLLPAPRHLLPGGVTAAPMKTKIAELRAAPLMMLNATWFCETEKKGDKNKKRRERGGRPKKKKETNETKKEKRTGKKIDNKEGVWGEGGGGGACLFARLSGAVPGSRYTGRKKRVPNFWLARFEKKRKREKWRMGGCVRGGEGVCFACALRLTKVEELKK
ncbi:MAG: hypothetical protein BJ554DRAFT_7646, partial [Olpidium bornovanus]